MCRAGGLKCSMSCTKLSIASCVACDHLMIKEIAVIHTSSNLRFSAFDIPSCGPISPTERLV